MEPAFTEVMDETVGWFREHLPPRRVGLEPERALPPADGRSETGGCET